MAEYIVQRGDTLFRIAVRNGLTVQQLAVANGITNPNLILVGQRLIIPGGDDTQPPPESTEEPETTEEPEATETPEATPEPQPTEPSQQPEPGETHTYIVQPGDTLFRIAARNNTTMAAILQVNPNITNPNLIFVGLTINLPGASTSEPPIVAPAEAIDVAFGTGIEIFLGEDIAAIVSQVTELGVDWVKFTVDWRDVEASQGDLQLAAVDEAVNAFDAAGLMIMLTLIGSPEWATPSATELALEQNNSIPPDDLSDFGEFAGALATRYAGQVDAYEIWSEPNLRINWMTPNVTQRDDGFPDARLATEITYVDLLEAAYDAIKAADAEAWVITAGLLQTSLDDNYNSVDTFVYLENLIDQGILDFSDAVGLHINGFANAPTDTCCVDGAVDDAIQFNDVRAFLFHGHVGFDSCNA